jgi:oligopeptidase B
MRLLAIQPGLALVVLIGGLAGCGHHVHDGELPNPPVAKRVPARLTLHGDTRVDNYYWIRDDTRSDPEVMKLLRAENKYTNDVMAPTRDLQERLFNEIAGRLQDSDRTVPVKEGEYFYHREFRAGHEYPVYVRRQDQPGAEPEVMLDVNELSKGHDYYKVGNWSVSPNDNLLAFAEDPVGRREYIIRFKNLATGKYLPDRIEGAESDLAWANDNKSLFYVHKDPETLLPYEVYRHELGSNPADDKLVYVEKDSSFYTSVYATRANQYIVIATHSTDSSEIRLIDADHPDAAPRVFVPREPGLQYQIRHVPGWFYVITNWRAENFRLMKTPENRIGDKSAWRQVVAARDNVMLEDVEVFAHYLALNETSAGLTHLRVIDRDTGKSRSIRFRDPTYTARLYSNPQVDSTKLRYVYSSLTTPESVYEYDMANGTTRLLKREKISGGFDPSMYTSERIFIKARDGTRVPVSLVYKTSLRRPGKNPLYVYGYGSYGIPADASFRALRLSLLDRGFVYAIVHVRGGNEMGREWYDDGRLLNKRNTFTDFIDATRALVRRGYGARNKVIAGGGSAGGLLMGVIANEAPQLYLGIIAHVPFVDVMTTMSDPSIPLTSGEFSEWGDPRIKKDYNYMLSYSPYDQVKAQDYPNMFVTTGLWDSQVQYYEPVKWVSKLRHLKTDHNLLLLHVDMETGHNGASGRYERYRLDALEYAFILRVLKRA